MEYSPQHAEVIALYCTGLSASEVARRTGYSHSRVHQIVTAAGVHRPRNKRKELVCAHCGKQFMPDYTPSKRRKKVHCSLACRNAAVEAANTRLCIICGKPYRAKWAQETGQRTCTSPECTREVQARIAKSQLHTPDVIAKRSESNLNSPKWGHITMLVCYFCGKEFETYKSQRKKPRAFCSRECVHEWQRTPEYRAERSGKVCAEVGQADVEPLPQTLFVHRTPPQDVYLVTDTETGKKRLENH